MLNECINLLRKGEEEKEGGMEELSLIITRVSLVLILIIGHPRDSKK